MLISFKAENFKSINESVVLSMIAINYYKENDNQLIKPELPGLSGVDLLRAAAIYGSNASGKSNLMDAIATMKYMVIHKDTLENCYEPFAFTDEASRPTNFEVSFVAEEIRYEYAFSFTKTCIVKEELAAYPKGRMQQWFIRKTDEKTGESAIKTSSSFSIPAAVKPLLNQNRLLLSLLDEYPNLKIAEKVRPIMNWYRQELACYDRGQHARDIFSITGDMLEDKKSGENTQSLIKQMIKKADVGISDIEVEETPVAEDVDNDLYEALVKVIKEKVSEDIELPETTKTLLFEHTAFNGKKAQLEIGKESEGTIQLFSLIGPTIKALLNGTTMIVDEIDSSLHPDVVEELVACFLDPEINPNNAQLIFTAHLPSLLKEDFLRRDQIWMTQKRRDGSTDLVALSEYSPRLDESKESAYLMGKYAAVPVIEKGFGLAGKIKKKKHVEE